MKCLNRHPWEECNCSSDEVNQFLTDKAWLVGVFCGMVAPMIWVIVA